MLIYKNSDLQISLLVSVVIGAKTSSRLLVCKVVKIINNPKNIITYPGAEIELERHFLFEMEEPSELLKEVL